MEKNKVYQYQVIDFKDWDESIKKEIEYVNIQLVGLDIQVEGLEELYFVVCFKAKEKFKGENQLRKKIERLLKTKKILFYHNLPF